MADNLNVIATGLSFPEGPRWHNGAFYFSDFHTHRVLRIATDGSLETVVDVPNRPSGLGWRPDGTLLVVSMVDRRLMALADGGLQPVADLVHATGNCNDMVVDARGRAYVGNFGFDRHAGETAITTCVQRVDPDGSVHVAADDLFFPNGTVITPDGGTLVVAETYGHRLTAFDVAADGSLSHRRVWADLDGGFPDGICLDAAGAIWIADPRNKCCRRVLEGGQIDRTIPTGDLGAYACMLGGEDRRTLYICTNSGSGPEMKAKRDGRIETIKVDVPGVGLP